MKTETLEPVETPTRTTHTGSRYRSGELVPSFVHLKNILVPVDLSEMSLKSLQYAIPFAKQFGAKLTLLHVIEPPIYTAELPSPMPFGPEYVTAMEKELEEIRRTRIPVDLTVATAIQHNFAINGILEAAQETHADLIITTTHGRTGLKHLLIGSTAENIVRKAPCPVLVVRERERDFVLFGAG